MQVPRPEYFLYLNRFIHLELRAFPGPTHPGFIPDEADVPASKCFKRTML